MKCMAVKYNLDAVKITNEEVTYQKKSLTGRSIDILFNKTFYIVEDKGKTLDRFNKDFIETLDLYIGKEVNEEILIFVEESILALIKDYEKDGVVFTKKEMEAMKTTKPFIVFEANHLFKEYVKLGRLI